MKTITQDILKASRIQTIYEDVDGKITIEDMDAVVGGGLDEFYIIVSGEYLTIDIYPSDIARVLGDMIIFDKVSDYTNIVLRLY